MDNLLTVAFEAHNPEKNHHCRYQVTVGRDPLDHWTVAIRYGRTGQAGRELRYVSAAGRGHGRVFPGNVIRQGGRHRGASSAPEDRTAPASCRLNGRNRVGTKLLALASGEV